MSDDSIRRLLGMSYQVTTSPDESEGETVPTIIDPAGDMAFARDHLRRVITRGEEVLTDLMEVAKSAQNDKIYQALASVYKAQVDANKELVRANAVASKYLGLQPTTEPEAPAKKQTINANNVVFVGSPEEMMRFKDVDPEPPEEE